MCFSGLAARAAAPDPRTVFAGEVLDGVSGLAREVYGSLDEWAACLASQDHLDPLHHAALYLYGVAGYRAWCADGGTPGVLAGYSLGVYVALTAAGCLEPEAGVELVIEAGYGIRYAQPALGHGLIAVNGLSVARAPEVVAALTTGGEAALTHVNSPSNFILTCPADGVEALLARALDLGAYTATAASFPGASHSHLMEPFLDRYQACVAGVRLADPQVPLFSCVTANPVRDATDARALLRDQLIRPVRFLDTIEAARPGGAGLYVVVGTCMGIPALLQFLRPESEVRLWPADREGGGS